MGQKYSDAWAEIWDDVKEVFASAQSTGQATMKVGIYPSGHAESTDKPRTTIVSLSCAVTFSKKRISVGLSSQWLVLMDELWVSRQLTNSASLAFLRSSRTVRDTFRHVLGTGERGVRSE